ncbi:MAG TPA: ComF family protein [Tepidisphaeraceae bacterium]|nr:ComF family protein [Tepidisphaeraceae bacterium]
MPQWVHDLSTLLYPGTCRACGDACFQSWVCTACRGELDSLAARSRCHFCARPFATDNSPCPWCAGKSFRPLAKIAALGPYSGSLRTLILHAKFHGQWDVAEHLADSLMQQPRLAQLLGQADLLVPIPLHWARQVARGYNQAEVLAAALSRRCRLPVDELLKRIRRTEPQTRLNARLDRARNVRGAFRLVRGGASAVAGKNVVLVDDVMTTAATLRSAARTLLTARPASISAVVVAVADPIRADFEMI